MILDPNDYRFTFTEMVGENPTDAMNVRNWMARDVFEIGQKHKLGRWLFSLTDIIRLRVVQSLTRLAAMPPVEANKIADTVVERYHELALPDGRCRFPLLYKWKYDSPAGRQSLYVTASSGVIVGTSDEAGAIECNVPYYKEPLSFAAALGGVPHLVVPMDEFIARTVMNFSIMAAEEAGEDWEKQADVSGSDNPFAEATTIKGMFNWYIVAGAAEDPVMAAKVTSAEDTKNG